MTTLFDNVVKILITRENDHRFSSLLRFKELKLFNNNETQTTWGLFIVQD